MFLEGIMNILKQDLIRSSEEIIFHNVMKNNFLYLLVHYINKIIIPNITKLNLFKFNIIGIVFQYWRRPCTFITN